jgi:MFS family permease
VLAILLHKAAVANDAHPSEANVRRERLLSAAGMPAMAITLTLASFDWIMSLNARWASDMMGVYLFAGALGAAVGATSVVAWLASRAKIIPEAVGPAHFHALGRLLLMTVLFWSYIAFCQFLLVWITDMDRESSFYVDRAGGSWRWAIVALFAFHFALPFLLLLSRALKRDPFRLALVGGGLVLAHALDVYWLVLPPLHAGMQGLDLAFLVGVGGIAASFGVWRYFAAAPIPIHDPALAESLRYESP